MRRAPAQPFIALKAFCLALGLVPLVALAEHRDVAPVPGEAVAAVRAAQHRRDDALAASLHRHLEESRALMGRAERSAGRLKPADARDTQGEDDLRAHRSAAAAKRLQIQELRSGFLGRVDAAIDDAANAGDSARVGELREFRAKLANRFTTFANDLGALESAERGTLGPRARRAAQRLERWLAPAADVPLPEPNWRQVEPLPVVDRTAEGVSRAALPAAGSPPRFVADTLWLMRHQVADAGGLLPVVLQPTSPEAAACGYDSADLAATAEAPKDHADIQALAAELDHDPVRIFQWVSQNVAYEPYYGSLKGGVSTLWAKAGGATDQASLLIALLRASNVPARYVRGVVRVIDNTALGANGRGPRWIGATTYQGAANIVASNGNPTASYGPSDLELAHVWVEACLPYAAYRGAALDDSGHRWVPLDPSFKDHRYQAGIAVDAGFDFNYSGWLASRLDAQGRYRLPQEQFEDEVAAHAKTKAPHYANNTLEDIPYKSEIKRPRFDILPIVPPYEIVQYTSWSGVAGESAETAALPDRHRHRLAVTVKTAADAVLAQKTLNLADVAAKRLTLAFRGATAADQSAYTTWLNGVNPASNPTCAATANVVPVLRLEGTELAKDSGSGTTTLCSANNKLNMTVTLAELGTYATRSVANYPNIAAASLHALHAYAWHTSDRYLADRADKLLAAVRANANPNGSETVRDATEGEFLNLAASKYSRYTTDALRRVGGLFGESGTSGMHLGLTVGQVKVNYLFDLPYGLFRKGFKIDWPGTVSTSRKLNGGAVDTRTFKLAGFAGSALEAYIWQESANLDAVSTTRGLQFAKEQGIEVLQINNSTDWTNQKCKLNNSCSNGALNTNPAGTNYTSADITQIQADYINYGYKLTIPRRLIQYPNSAGWLGYTFYAERFSANASDPKCSIGTLCAGFPIAGSSGGITVEPNASGAEGTGTGSDGTDTSYGGDTGSSTPVSNVYNSLLGTGRAPEAQAPVVAQNQGEDSYAAAKGVTAGTTQSADPVNMVTGNLIHSERDIAIKGRGGLPIVFERWYNSQAPKDGPLGYGWTHSFNHFIRFYGVESGVAKISWSDGTGGERYFSTTNHSSGNIAVGASFSVPAGIYATVERLSGGTYRITERSGMKYLFESVNGTATDTGQKARLLSITDRNGNALTLGYEARCGTPVCTVTDALGRQLVFTYTAGRLVHIGDWSGREFRYEYDANGDLISFKNPLAAAGSQPPVTYQYHTAADNLAHAMKQYQLPRGNGMRFEYYANGRVFRHTPFDTAGALLSDYATTFAWSEFRRESRQIDAQGYERVFLFDKYGNPIAITDEAGAQTTYTYDTATGRTHLRLSKTDAQGMTTGYAYDGAGNLTDVTLPSGRSVQYRDHTAYGQPQRVKDAANNWTLYRFDALGNLTDEIRTRAGVTPTAGVKPANADILAYTQYANDVAGNPILVRRLRDWSTVVISSLGSGTGKGPSLETSYDANLLNVASLTRRGDLDGTPASLETETFSDFQYDALGRQTRGPDGAWYPADSSWDALDRPLASPDGRGHTWAQGYDANGNLLTRSLVVNGALIDGGYLSWDALDRLERSVDYAGNATATEYNPLGHVTAVTGPDGYTVGFDRDPLGRITGAYDEGGHRVSITRDAEGRVRSTTDPNGLVTATDYHHAAEDGRLKKTTLPKVTGQSAGRAVEVVAYDGLGNPRQIHTLAADGTVRDSFTFHDELGRLTREVGPQINPPGDTSRPVTCYVYTTLSDLKEVWAGSTTDTTSTTCNLADPNLKKQLTATFDDWGRKLSETDANGNTWRWTWNVHNELVSSQSPVQAAAGQSTKYAYGANVSGETQGLLKSRTVPGSTGQTVAYARNALGQVTRAETKDGGNSLVVAYDYTFDAAHRLATVKDSRGGKTLSYTWTPGGRLARVEDSDGHSLSVAWDAVGRLASLTAPNGESVTFTWDAGGRLIEQRLTSGLRTTQAWFEDGGLKERKNLYNSTTLSSHSYTLDVFGRRATQSENVGGTTKSWTYGYDRLDRLTSASDGTAETYSYDVWGNRRTKTKSGTTTAYLYDAAHQLAEVRSGSDVGALIGAAIHDADGHLTKLCEVAAGGTVTKTSADCTASGTGATTLSLAWNALEHLLTATRTGVGAVSESYAYDDGGRRIRKTSAGVTSHFLYDGDAIHAEWTGSAIAGMPAAVYAQGAGIDTPILRLTGATNGPGATQAAFLQDGLGSVVGTVSTAGTLTASQRFDAWGVKTAGSGTVPQYGYTGREPDATGLVFYRARYYHPGIGRFASRDPMGMVDAVSPYAYVANNPANLVDPTGMYAAPSSSVAFGSGSGGGKGPTVPSSNVTLSNNSGPTQQTLNAFGLDQRQGVQVACVGPVLFACIGGVSDLVLGTGAVAGTAIYNSTNQGSGSRSVSVPSALDTTFDEEPQKIYATYTRTNPLTGQVYSGRTSGYGNPADLVRARGQAADHQELTKQGYLAPVLDQASTNSDAIRGREQLLIDANGGAKSVGGTSGNKIQGIGNLNIRGQDYVDAARREFGNLPDNSPDRFRLWK